MNATIDEPRQLTSPDRHILNAQHTWLEENGLVPMIVVIADHPALNLPDNVARQPSVTLYDPYFGGVAQVGRAGVALNISYRSTSGLRWQDEGLMFSATFGGIPHDCFVPYCAVTEIFGRGDERTRHLFPRRAFERVDDSTITMADDDVLFGNNTVDVSPAPTITEPVKPARDRSHLKVVK